MKYQELLLTGICLVVIAIIVSHADNFLINALGAM